MVLINTGALKLFILEKIVGKLGLLVSKSTKKINVVNYKVVFTMEVV